jgi:hypothetical protein
MTDLFNSELIAAHEKVMFSRIVENAKKEETPEILTERQSLQSRLDFLKKVGAIHRLVDKNLKTEILSGLRLVVDERIVLLEENIVPYLTMRGFKEVSLLPTHGTFHGEHALLSVFVAKHGVVALVDGMRYFTRETFAIGDIKSPGTHLNIDILVNIVISPFKVGLNDFVIRSMPIFKPKDIGYEELYQKVRYWLHSFMPINDGFIQWDNPESARVMELMRPGWWE